MGWYEPPTKEDHQPAALPSTTIRVRQHDTDFEVVDGDTVLFTRKDPVEAIALAQAVRDGVVNP